MFHVEHGGRTPPPHRARTASSHPGTASLTADVPDTIRPDVRRVPPFRADIMRGVDVPRGTSTLHRH